MNYWLIKSEPSVYAWSDLQKDKKTGWDGVRNFQARNNLKAYPDPKEKDWVLVDVAPHKKLKNPVSLAQIKADKRFSDMILVRVSRLSVQPVKPEEFDMIVALSENG
jgi:predicted RNA-binding protein with PUA-like domain